MIERWVTINGRSVPIRDGEPDFGGEDKGGRKVSKQEYDDAQKNLENVSED